MAKIYTKMGPTFVIHKTYLPYIWDKTSTYSNVMTVDIVLNVYAYKKLDYNFWIGENI